MLQLWRVKESIDVLLKFDEFDARKLLLPVCVKLPEEFDRNLWGFGQRDESPVSHERTI
mgnify:CR=1 FL=1